MTTSTGKPQCQAVAHGTTVSPEPMDMMEDEAYQRFVESMAQHCRCRSGDRPCDGVLAGGLCDDFEDLQGGGIGDEEDF